jgi:hypothetical protein
MFFLIANVTETLETASEFGQNAQRGHWPIGFVDEWLSIWLRGGKITTIRDAVHEAGIDDYACAKRQQPSGGDPIG